MDQGNNIVEGFGDYAGNLVNDYVTELSVMAHQRGIRPSYEELFQLLKLVNDELTFRAVKLISRFKQHNKDIAPIVRDYKAIITNSITRLCDEASAIIVSPS